MDLEMEHGEIFTLMGPSGSGKTSLLRTICGLEEIDEGRIVLDGRDITHLPPSRRGTGMVFQDLALFPHLTVYENIAFGLRASRLREEEIRGRIKELAVRLNIEEMLSRYPDQLSGGQRQRVALARTLAPSPKLLLLDEPLSSLDEQLRAEVRGFIKATAREFEITVIYVTHDHREGLFMADRGALIFDGRIAVSGRPEELFREPRTEKIARFFGYNVVRFNDKTVAFLPSDCIPDISGELEAKVVSYGFEGESMSLHAITQNGETIRIHLPPDGSSVGGDMKGRIRFSLRRMVELRSDENAHSSLRTI
ncbi:MAG: ABC transporter ATP-binding protein [Methanomassiliicoccales archaeon]